MWLQELSPLKSVIVNYHWTGPTNTLYKNNIQPHGKCIDRHPSSCAAACTQQI